MDVVRQQVTADELLLMPDDGFRYELVKGELRRMNPAGNVHGRVTMSVAWRLARDVQENQLGTVYAAETGFRLASDPDTVRAPDVAFVSQARVEAVGEVEGSWPEAPDLAVEVVSPGDSYAEVEEKVFDWLEAGTRMVVVVNPRQRSATVYKAPTEIIALAEADVLNGGDVVPVFELPIRKSSSSLRIHTSATADFVVALDPATLHAPIRHACNERCQLNGTRSWSSPGRQDWRSFSNAL